MGMFPGFLDFVPFSNIFWAINDFLLEIYPKRNQTNTGANPIFETWLISVCPSPCFLLKSSIPSPLISEHFSTTTDLISLQKRKGAQMLKTIRSNITKSCNSMHLYM